MVLPNSRVPVELQAEIVARYTAGQPLAEITASTGVSCIYPILRSEGVRPSRHRYGTLGAERRERTRVELLAAMQAAAAAGIGTLGFPGALARTGGLGVPGRGGEVAVLSMAEVDAAWRRGLRQAAE